MEVNSPRLMLIRRLRLGPDSEPTKEDDLLRYMMLLRAALETGETALDGGDLVSLLGHLWIVDEALPAEDGEPPILFCSLIDGLLSL